MRVLISDYTQYHDHAEKIAREISRGYGSDISDDILIRYDQGYYADLAYADANNIEMLVRSMAGLFSTTVVLAAAHYPNLQCFYPLGSNQYIELSFLSAVPLIIPCGAGDTQNRTGYGNALEFWDVEEEDEGFQSSYSPGRICGKLGRIKDALNCSTWEARYRARMTTGQSWTKYNGYGRIDVDAAIAYEGEIPTDPYLPVPQPPPPSTMVHEIYVGQGANRILYADAGITCVPGYCWRNA